VGQAEALAKVLGVPPSLFSAPASGGSGASSSGLVAGGLVRRLVGAEYSWATPFTAHGGKAAESPLVKSLLEGDLGRLLASSRGFIGFAVHFEHGDGGSKAAASGSSSADDDDAPLCLTPGDLASAAARDKGTSSEGYESYGAVPAVKGILHLHWASEGLADECDRLPDTMLALDELLAPFTADPKKALHGDLAAEAANALAAQQKASRVTRFRARVDKWPLSLPGQGPAPFVAHAAKKSGGKSTGTKKAGARGAAAIYVRLKFRTEAHAQQGRRLYRDKVLDPASALPGFLQAWFECDPASLACRITLLWHSAADRDAAFDEANSEFAGAVAPLSKAGTLAVVKGRTVAPDTMPDPSNRGYAD
jgi:hypothetical protein